jgi:type IV pilus assembly protein PilN
MIKINLATKKRPATASVGRGLDAIRIDSGQLQAIGAQLLEFPLKKIGLALGISVAATVTVDIYRDDMLKTEQAEFDKVNAEKPRLEAEANKMKGLQELQKSMEADEKRIRTKLETVKKLIAGRGAAAVVLEELAKITPSSVWLSDVTMKGNELALKGGSKDLGNISDFTRMIQSSAMFSDMTLKDTQMALDEQKRQIASFSVTAKKR